VCVAYESAKVTKAPVIEDSASYGKIKDAGPKVKSGSVSSSEDVARYFKRRPILEIFKLKLVRKARTLVVGCGSKDLFDLIDLSDAVAGLQEELFRGGEGLKEITAYGDFKFVMARAGRARRPGPLQTCTTIPRFALSS